jgi:plastocyanin
MALPGVRNRRVATLKAMALAGLVVLGAPPGGGGRAAASRGVELSISNFRFCAAPSCSPADSGYVRSNDGPVAGTDNPHGIVDVPQGGTVQWVYRDVGPGSCDSFEQCPGHDVRFENGTAEGLTVGGAQARNGPTAISATITQKPGELIRYFCSINGHYRLGMTGILRVVR